MGTDEFGIKIIEKFFASKYVTCFTLCVCVGVCVCVGIYKFQKKVSRVMGHLIYNLFISK